MLIVVVFNILDVVSIENVYSYIKDVRVVPSRYY